MAGGTRRARDLPLLDALDKFPRQPFDGKVWRVVRNGRDPLLASPSISRWCNGTFDVLYTSMERDGALAEIFALLSLQPVFPSVPQWLIYQIDVAASQTLRLADLPTLAKLGVDVARYTGRHYSRTQEIADAACFLGFDGLLAPSARWNCLNAMLFADRIPPDQLSLASSAGEVVDWADWRGKRRPK